jgi:hypothetical protein
LLDSEHESTVDVFDEMIQDFVDSGHMNKENKDQVRETLCSKHKHSQPFQGGLGRKKSTISDFFPIGSRRASAFNSELGSNTDNTSSLTSRKNSSVHTSELNMNKAKAEKLSISEINLENGVSFTRIFS